MRPLSLEVREFRGWRDSGSIPLDRPITLLVGANGQGKSSTAAAVEWCLFGREVETAGGLGIDERAAWEVRPREAGRGPTEVSLALEGKEGSVTVVRRRAAGAAAKTPDDLEVRTAGGRLAGAEAEAWIGERLPDLETFRRAHALHPETLRRRATDKADREAILAILLGLDRDQEARDRLKAVRAPDLVKEVDVRLRRLEADLEAATERPRRERDEVERRLAGRGLGRGDLSAARAVALRSSLVERGAQLATRLGLDTRIPAPTDADAVRAWAQTWPMTARERAPALSGLQVRRNGLNNLAAHMAALEPLEARLAEARRRYEETVRVGGDRAARERAVAEAAARAKEADAAMRRAGALIALLEDAEAFVPDVDERAPCPVCATPVLGLRARIADAVERHRSVDASRGAEAKAKAVEAHHLAQRALEDLDALERLGHAARERRDAECHELAKILPPAPPGEARDLAAAARARMETLEGEIESLEAVARERDESLARHQEAFDLLRDVEAWLLAVARLDRDVELSHCPSWPRLDAAIDAVAGFACDVETLSATARDAQAERSEVRGAAANHALSAYYDAIVGEGGRGLRVLVHQTAKGLDYRLVDLEGHPAVPILNQAAINAVSLALLFAQAEERARTGGLAWVLLDDPAQSLDEERQAGLARAIERLSETCAVFVATTEAPLVDRVRDFVARPRRLLRLGPRDPRKGAWIESREER